MKAWVIDASVLVKLFFEEEHSPAAVRWVRGASQLLAPDLIWAESANVVWKRLRRGEISRDDALSVVKDILRFPVMVSPSADLIEPAIVLAAETDRTVYDCLCLALAVRVGVPLLTADERLANSLSTGPLANHVRFVGAKAGKQEKGK